jgi:hypothetical protein
MVVIPGDRVRIGARTMTVAEAYLHNDRLVQLTSTDGRIVWVAPWLVRRAEPDGR